MSEILVGDTVLVKRDDAIVPSTVLATFQHYRHAIRFVDIYTAESTTPLRLTPLHSLLVLSKQGKNGHYSFAQDVSVGDFVVAADLHPLRVIDVQELFMYDDYVYAPLTFEGNLVVNGLVASCYGTYSHATMHLLTIPLRWWYLALFEFHRVMGLRPLQKLTSDLIVYFLDFVSK